MPNWTGKVLLFCVVLVVVSFSYSMICLPEDMRRGILGRVNEIATQTDDHVTAELKKFRDSNILPDKSFYYSNEAYCDAIYTAEGGKHTKWPYGIKSVRCRGEQDCRQVCMNTVRNNKDRWLNSDRSKTFIEFLGSKYCPGDNNWITNVSNIIKQ